MYLSPAESNNYKPDAASRRTPGGEYPNRGVERNTFMDRQQKILLSACLALVVCLCCLGVAGGSMIGAFAFLQQQPAVQSTSSLPPTKAPTSENSGNPGATISPTGENQTPSAFPLDLSDPVSASALESLQSLLAGDPPAGDLVEQAERLKGIVNIPRVTADHAAPVPVGTAASFYISNEDTKKTSSITAVMRYATPHVYFWVDQGASANNGDIRTLVDKFEKSIYPTDREFFGTEWTPGVDGDPHLYILYAKGLGNSVAGYFSSVDEFSRLANPFSNQHEMFYINADAQKLSDNYTLTVLAHEFQHMIHWYGDPNEDGWINEGFSELAVLLNGFNLGGFDLIYAQNTDLQLNTWPDPSDTDTASHYGASFLFLDYFLNRFGSDATKALVHNPENGLTGIDNTLRTLGITDPSTGRTVTADDVMADFAAALLLQDTSFENGRYGFKNYSGLPSLESVQQIGSCPTEKKNTDVTQYGIDYYRLKCSGPLRIYFSGQTQEQVLPVDPQDGKYYVWSNRGDQSDMTLTRAFALPSGSAATLQYDLWYDVEKDWDYVYLEASVDGGQTWTMLHTPSGTGTNPEGNNSGWGWTGKSGGGSDPAWIHEQADLSAYAGKHVLVRFEYITDAAVNGAGLIVDNIRIPEISYAADFEDGLDGWDGKGFVRLQNVLPQSYRVLVVRRGSQTTVEEFPLDDRMSGSISLTSKEGEEVYLIVVGTARFTNQKAPYQFIVLS
jgi:immune inhibitor A